MTDNISTKDVTQEIEVLHAMHVLNATNPAIKEIEVQIEEQEQLNAVYTELAMTGGTGI